MIDYAELKRLAEAFPDDLDWDSNTEPFFNGPSGESLGGGSTGFYSVYGQPFEIDGDTYDGNEYVPVCTKDFAKFVCSARDGVLALFTEIERLQLAEKNDLIAYKAAIERQSELRQERDDIQLRLHAIDHAYNEQQRSENKLILEQQEIIRRQRKFIRTLYTSRKARKSKGSTSGQSKRENVADAKSGGNDGVSEVVPRREDVVRQEEGLRSGQIGCNGQTQMIGHQCMHKWVGLPGPTSINIRYVCLHCGIGK